MEKQPEQFSSGMTIADLRKERGENQSEFGAHLELSAGKVSEIETGMRPVSLRVALAIENLSVLNGQARIDAATLNDDVKKARGACVAVCHSSDAPAECQGADAAASPADDPDVSFFHNAGFSAADLAASTGNAGEISRHNEGVHG